VQPVHTDDPNARIGPNAITQVTAALQARFGPERAAAVLREAGLENHLHSPPSAMVPESDVVALHRVLRAGLDVQQREAVCRDAGERTADYLLANRIPRPVQALLRLLPATLASRVLLAAIGRHAWTFAGSGRFDATAGNPVRLSIQGCALCRGAVLDSPGCSYYAATFERLYRVLVSRRARAREVACEGCGGPACRFEVEW
jgi:divinyl protochlorophyllide a 8-vinyl-reductase